MTSDPIADMLTRVRNAIQARHPKVDVPASKLKTEIASILKEESYIANCKVAEEGVQRTIKIYLKYATDNSPVISAIERVSRPGCRVYVGQSDIPDGIALDSAGNVYVTGDSRGSNPEDIDYATIKYLADGTPAWTNRYSASGIDVPFAIAVDGAGQQQA